MWDTVDDVRPLRAARHLSRDLPCPRCGHDVHTFLACSDQCACGPCVMPGAG